MQDLMDWPPIWLLVALALTALLDWLLPWGLFGDFGVGAGSALIVMGVALMLAAVWQMRAARTTIIPRRDPAALVTGGVFRLSRNPIYLGDALVLAGVILWRDVPLAAPLVPLFLAVIQGRFIMGEEARLRAAFGRGFDDWAQRVRRWI
ncbi:MAG: isoprenylcysteine carboxylmethyltransferase family protein [Paracoccaceae bacterium]|nr:isoprenylcysteine carboxylmethyltransferase family protein [Paracoccaceae bacterium]